MYLSHNPRIYQIAQTSVNHGQIAAMINDAAIGGNGHAWVNARHVSQSGSLSAGEEIVEIAGRLCYKSFEVGLNPNITKVREDPHKYLGNILKSGHGSVLEHSSVTFAFLGVSRVFTHELVRHRAGMAFSQESLRFVRLGEIPFWLPTGTIAENNDIMKSKKAQQIMIEAVEASENAYTKLSKLFGIEKMSNFAKKKRLTSMFRRIAPIGLSTNIIMTGNHRAWRHIIEMRTSLYAEEEVRLVIGKVAKELKQKFPSLYQDMVEVYHTEDDYQLPCYSFVNSKI